MFNDLPPVEEDSVPADKTYVHYGEALALACKWKLKTPGDEVTSTAWTIDNSATTDGVTGGTASSNALETKLDTANNKLTKSSGATYKCSAVMKTKDDMDVSTSVLIHCK